MELLDISFNLITDIKFLVLFKNVQKINISFNNIDNIIELFGKLLPEFSIDDSNEILKIVSEMNLSEVNEVTLKLLENFFNSKEKNEK